MESITEKASYKKLMPLSLFLFLIIIYGIWEFYIRNDVYKYGVFTKCVIVNVLGYKGGIRLETEYSFKGIKYKSLINYAGDRIRVGDQYFIKILPNDPSILIFSNNLVPTCLLDSVSPFEGWKNIPVCK